MIKRARTASLVVMTFVCLMVMVSCATMQPVRYKSGVDSLAQTDASAKTRYIIMPGIKDVEPSDLQFLEYANYVEKILNERGFVKASQFADADIAIFLSYGIGNPQTHQYSYSLPVWGQTGVSSSSTQGTLSTYGGMGTYSGTTTYTPTYGVTGYTSHVSSYTTFTRFLFMDAYDVASYKQDQKMNQVWKTSVISTGLSDDLRLVFPYMAVAMKPYIGTNTGRKIMVEIIKDDPQVTQLRGGAPSEPRKK
jgi:hypothetical protein